MLGGVTAEAGRVSAKAHVGGRRQPDFKRGQRIGDYVLDRSLGAGQDGEVWLAKKVSIAKTCAIKFLKGIESQETRQRFAREIQILAKINHPHVEAIIDRDEAWNPATGQIVPCYVTEYLDALPLDRAFSEMSSEDLLPWFFVFLTQVASALASIHAAGVTHGDMKPSNVLVISGVRTPKIADFGFGRLSDEARGEYPNVSYRPPSGLSREAGDVYRLGRTFQDCLKLQADRLPPVHAMFLGELLERLVGDPSGTTLQDLVQNARVAPEAITGGGRRPEHGGRATQGDVTSSALKALTGELARYIRSIRRKGVDAQPGHEALEALAGWAAKLERESSVQVAGLEEMRGAFRTVWDQLLALAYTEDLTSQSTARKYAALLWLTEHADPEHISALQGFVMREADATLRELGEIAAMRAGGDHT